MLPKIKTVQDFQKLLLRIFVLLFMLFFSVAIFGQEVVVSEYFNDATQTNEWSDNFLTKLALILSDQPWGTKVLKPLILF